MFARENFTRFRFFTRTYFRRRMIEGSLMANVMAWTCWSYSSMTSTFPAKNKVRAFFQEIMRSGSYEAFNSSVAFILKADFSDWTRLCQAFPGQNPCDHWVLTNLLQCLTCWKKNSICDAFFAKWVPASWHSAGVWTVPTSPSSPARSSDRVPWLLLRKVRAIQHISEPSPWILWSAMVFATNSLRPAKWKTRP